MGKKHSLGVQLLKLAETCLFASVVQSLSRLVPKDQELVVFIPMDSGRYTDNAAHLYELWRMRGLLPANSYLLLARRPYQNERWVKNRPDTEPYNPYSPSRLWRYLRTSIVITDHRAWGSANRFACFAGAKKIQLWHGIPLKQVELSHRDAVSKKRTRCTNLKRRILHSLRGRYPEFDIVISSSPFFEANAFRPSFRSKRFLNCGYPRNDLFFLDRKDRPRVDIDRDALQQIKQRRAQGAKIVLYAPTFRDTGGGPFMDGAVDLQHLSAFAEEQNLLFVIKQHVYAEKSVLSTLGKNILLYDSRKDSAELLAESDLLVTDYSSIFIDFLLLDRPIVFFPYDGEKYFEKDRGLLFDYDDVTPGPKCSDFLDLLKTIGSEIHAPNESFRLQRRAFSSKAHMHRDGNAHLRILEAIRELV